MREIWKYRLHMTDDQEVLLPMHAQPLHVGYQRNALCVWVLVHPENPVVLFDVHIAGTGYPVPDEWNPQEYVGTVVGEVLVWHVFMRRRA